MRQEPLSVLVLHEALDAGARPDELDALVQVEQVSAAIRQLGWAVSTLATSLDLAATLAAIHATKPDCIFNLVESLAGDARMIHFIPALLRKSRVPFTGADSDAQYLSSHKLLAKNLMRQHDIPTPAFFTRDGDTKETGHAWIVKSVWEHASFGLDDGCVVDSVAKARTRIEECRHRHGGEWFAEQFIEGREFNLAVLENDGENAGQPLILPMAEMTFVGYPQDKPKIVGYAAKWDQSAPEYHATQRVFPTLDDNLRQALQNATKQCWKYFGLSGYARVDFRIDGAGLPWVLEINANPCIAQDAGFTAAAAQAGIPFEQLVEQIVRAALQAK